MDNMIMGMGQIQAKLNENVLDSGKNQRQENSGIYNGTSEDGDKAWENNYKKCPRKQFEDPQLTLYLQAAKNAKCSQGDKSTYICSSENSYQSALTCDKSKQNNLCTWAQLQKLITEIHKKKLQVDIIEEIQQIYDEILENVYRSAEQMVHEVRNKELTNQQRKLMKFINMRSFDKITGNDVYEVVKGLRNKSTVEEFKEENLIGQFRVLSQNISQALKKTKQEFVDYTSEEKLPIDSKVIESVEDLAKLKKFFPQEKRPIGFEMCYRASESNFDVNKWKEKCGGLHDTVTLIKTTSGKIIGGYTPLSWRKDKYSFYETDESGQSFLFSITENDKFTLKPDQKNNAIYHDSNYGPTFGAGDDLYISQNSQNNYNSYANIGRTYSNPKYAKDTKSAWQRFTGSSQNFRFKSLEWQTHKLIVHHEE